MININFFEKLNLKKDEKIEKMENLASHNPNTQISEIKKTNEEIEKNDEERILEEEEKENLGLNSTTKVSQDIEEKYMNTLEKGAKLEDQKFNLIKGN